jgi:site-specific recombinase XerD
MDPTIQGALALTRSATGPLSKYLKAYVSMLIEQGYATVSVRSKAWHAVEFDAWLAREGALLEDLADDDIARYQGRLGVIRSDCGPTPRRNELINLRGLMQYLRGQGLCEPPAKTANPAELIIGEFEEYLIRQRGLASGTVAHHCKGAAVFLASRFHGGHIDVSDIRSSDVISYVEECAKIMSIHRIRTATDALRSFFRYTQFRGLTTEALVCAVPAVAGWATTPPLPRAISPEHAQRAIEGCDKSTADGRRDRAILLLLARLGLRGGEVNALLLDDVSWETGRLRVRGKNRRECLMPLPCDVGEAIADYLQHGRPASADRRLFLRARAPHTGLLHGSDGIGSVVRNALRRAGVDAPHKGSHQFRHALAVKLLRDGASLREISDVLRHRDLIATSVYARVDLEALRQLPMPWPGRTS